MFHIIDDDEMIREMLVSVLCIAGYEALGFKSGEKYIQYMISADFEAPIAVLSDVTMPDMNGYDLAIEIRKELPLQIIVFISGNSDAADHECATQEVCFVLNKPFHPDKLISMLKEVVLPCHAYLTTENIKENSSKCVNSELFECPLCRNI
ncbi:MAG: response regulator [Ghiorsea sp.]